jgi:predicted nucleotidyltransferase
MSLNNPVIEQRVVQALRVLGRHMTVCAGYVFGSHVDGTPDAYSDIDLAVFVEGLERWDIFQRADMTALVQGEVGDDIELHWPSVWLPGSCSMLGFDQRLARLGTLLSAAILNGAPTSLEPLTVARQEIRGHDQSQRERRRLDRIDMALRLVQWLTRVDAAATSFCQSLAEAAAYHLAEGGFVDWARLSLRGGEPVRALSEAYARLFNTVTAIREQQARQFAELIRDWTVAGSVGDGVLPVERILDEISAPMAAQAPVLVIVIDGMSVAVCRELVADITRQEWIALCEQGREANRPGLTALPSITEVSRTSLLCGQLRQGNAAVEKNGFAEHPGLRAHCRSGSMPVLFHKPSLQEADDTSLAAEVRNESAASPDCWCSRERRRRLSLERRADRHPLVTR